MISADIPVQIRRSSQDKAVAMNQLEHFFYCPHCGEPISVLLDLSVEQQNYIEDCEVCCAPIEISYQVSAEELISFSAQT